jgi:hypothetical protein
MTQELLDNLRSVDLYIPNIDNQNEYEGDRVQLRGHDLLVIDYTMAVCYDLYL